MAIHVGKRSSREGWISFESDPHLSKTKSNIYAKCFPCLTGLREQLLAGKKEIVLKEALSCWKITVVLENIRECEEVLESYQERYPDCHVYGKYGTGRPESNTKVVSFHAENEKERDLVLIRLQGVAGEIIPKAVIFISRACAGVYAELLGDWKSWKKTNPVKNSEKIPQLIERLNKMLYYTG